MEPPWNLQTYLDMGVIYIKTPWNLHGTSMEPPWNLHQSDYRRNTFKTYLKTPWNLHQTSMKSENTCGEHRYIEKTC